MFGRFTKSTRLNHNIKVEILDSHKKKDFLKEVSYLGEFKTNKLFISTGSETVRVYSGHLHVDEILKIWRHFPIEGLGLYFGKMIIDKHGRKEARLSLDALHLMKDQIKEHIVEINQEQAEKWFRGNNLELSAEQKAQYKGIVGYVAVKFKDDLIGTGKLTEGGILLSFLPKERRIRN
jgi:NOL1/NOP2/fmu family ribosome biogenesis protein